MSNKEKIDHVVKLLLIGDACVGKSCLLRRFAEDTFSDSYEATIGIDMLFKVIDVDGKKVKLQVWDTSGQERFKTITSSYYRGCHAIIIVYDVTDQDSFEGVCRFMTEIERFAREGMPTLLVGNKVDLELKRVVNYSTAKEFAEENKIIYMETSAKNATDTDKPFVTLAHEIISKLPNAEDGPTYLASTHRGKQKQTKSRTCSLL